MPAPTKVSDLAERKRQIVAEADRHRDAIGLEFRRITRCVGDGREFVQRNRWWLWGGATVVAGVLLSPTLRSTLGTLAGIVGWLRSVRR